MNHGRRMEAALVLAAGLLASAQAARPTLVWQAQYDGPLHGEERLTGCTVNRQGEIYLAGYSFGGQKDFDFATVKLASSGETLWTRRYGSPAGKEDRAWAIGLDSDGNAVVAGGAIVDTADGWDFELIKYSPAGDTLWVRTLDLGYRGDDRPVAMTVTTGDCPVVVGNSARRARPRSSGRDADIAIAKYSPAGETVWTRLVSLESTGSSLSAKQPTAPDQELAAAAIDDGSGNVYVCGSTGKPPFSTDMAVLKMGPDGRLLWHDRVDGPKHATDYAQAILCCGKDRLFVIGAAVGEGTSYDCLAACYDTLGNRQWQHLYDGSGKVDIGQAGCVDDSGNLILASQSTGSGTSFDIVTAKYSGAGDLRWVRRYDGGKGGIDRGWCIAADSAGNVYVGGNSGGASGFADIVILGYSRAGDTLWTYRHTGTGNGDGRPAVMQVLEGEKLLVAGTVANAATVTDYVAFLLDLNKEH